MATIKPRVNITLDESTVALLAQLAQQEHTSVSNVTKELILEALERREDRALSAIAEVRDIMHAKRIKHTDAWK